tara:strand:+ start:1141 stop:1917 length:777 start_codon:yes stop_codon:yes gene_type:complete
MPQYNIVTSLNKKYWELGSRENIQTWDKHLPEGVKLHIFSEDLEVSTWYRNAKLSDRVIWYSIYEACPKLRKFLEVGDKDPFLNGEIMAKEKFKFKWQATKFAHKTFPIFRMAEGTGKLVWLDADAMIHTPMDFNFLDSLQPEGYGISYLGRPSVYDECGFMLYDLDNPSVKKFLKDFEEMYTTLKLKELRETHDSFIFTTLRIQHPNKDLFFDLNKGAKTNKHPFNSSILRPKMVHMKGTKKKEKMGKFLKRHKVDI